MGRKLWLDDSNPYIMNPLGAFKRNAYPAMILLIGGIYGLIKTCIIFFAFGLGKRGSVHCLWLFYKDPRKVVDYIINKAYFKDDKK